MKLILLLVSTAALLTAACERGPHGIVSNVTRNEHPQLVNGDVDWGSEVGFDVRNEAGRGTIQVIVTLSSSEGQWDRSQNVFFEPGESKHLTYFFQEPTISATNLQALVRVDR